MWGRVYSMVRKEFQQLSRDVPIIMILIWAFSGAIYVAGHAVDISVKDLPIAFYDLDRSAASRDLLTKIRSPYFKWIGAVHSDTELDKVLISGRASAVIVIPSGFETKTQSRQAQVQVIIDGGQSRAALLAVSYLASILQKHNIDMLTNQAVGGMPQLKIPQIDPRVRVAYNQSMTHAWFGSLLELFNVMTMVAMLLTAAALVREKSQGTLDQLLVSPLTARELFIAKIIPTVITVLALSLVGLFVMVQGVFNTPIRGSLVLFYSVATLYVFSISSLGILVAVVTRSIAQATLLIFMILMPMLFLSGAMTPPESMSTWMKTLSLISPMRYFIDFGYEVLLKGNGIAEVWHDILGILVLGGALFALAVRQFNQYLK